MTHAQTLITRITESKLPTAYGEFRLIGYTENQSNQEHIALVMGDINNGQAVLARLHSECLTGDALFSQRCDCGPQLQAAMQKIQQQGRGIIIYLRQEGRGIGLINKIKAYHLQDEGLDTVEANLALGLPIDNRNFALAKYILDDLNVHAVRLMTNNPNKIEALKKIGLNIVERVPLQVGIQQNNQAYISTKTHKLGHLFNLEKNTKS